MVKVRFDEIKIFFKDVDFEFWRGRWKEKKRKRNRDRAVLFSEFIILNKTKFIIFKLVLKHAFVQDNHISTHVIHVAPMWRT